MARPKRTYATQRDYPRTARLNELMREIIADQLERIDDERLELLTVVSVEVEPDLRHAMVYYDCLDGEEGDEDALAALGAARVRLQAAIGRQARTKRVPELAFAPDPAIRAGARIDEVLRDLGPIDDSATSDLATDDSPAADPPPDSSFRQ